jgi:hypothetical protein
VSYSPLNRREKSPDLARLQRTGVQITTALSGCRAIFNDLTVLAPQSAPVMREYAGFLLELANDPRKATELLTDAEQIEDERSRALSSQSHDVDVSFGACVNLVCSLSSPSTLPFLPHFVQVPARTLT